MNDSGVLVSSKECDDIFLHTFKPPVITWQYNSCGNHYHYQSRCEKPFISPGQNAQDIDHPEDWQKQYSRSGTGHDDGCNQYQVGQPDDCHTCVFRVLADIMAVDISGEAQGKK